MTNNTFAAWVARYRPDPVLFVQEVLGADPDPWQKAVLEAYGRGERRISIRSCHRAGKTVVMSWMALHQILCHYRQKTVATAPSSQQLFDALASEMKSWCSRMPDALRELLVVKTDRIELKADPDGSFISFRTSRSDSPEALQGVHSDRVLLLVDEASGVPEAIFEASLGSMAGEHAITVLASNPTRSSGLFFDSHNRIKDSWFTVHVSMDVPEASPTAYKSPRIASDFDKDVAERYDGRDTNAFRVRVLGEFPRSDIDTLIPFEHVDGARRRDITVLPNTPVSWGLDVADQGDDRTALCKRQGNVVLEPVKTRAGYEPMQVVGWVREEYENTPVGQRPVEILVDAIGVGSGVASRLRELGLPAQSINVAESPATKAEFFNLRAEIAWRGKEWFQARDCSFPDDEATISELLGIRSLYNGAGKLQIQSKKDMKKATRKSPDRADSFFLTFAGSAALMSSGWSPTGPWNTPIRRNLPGVY